MRFLLKLFFSALIAKSVMADVNQVVQTASELNLPYQTQPNFRQQEVPQSENTFAGYANPDPVHQYVSSFNGNQLPAEARKEAPGFTDATPGYSAYPNSNGHPPYSPGSFAIQTGYEGYLVPSLPQQVLTRNTPVNQFTNSLAALTTNLPQTVRSATGFLRSSFDIFVRLLGLTVFGGGITTAICTFTPLCTIAFALPLVGLRSNVRDMASSYMSPENTAMFEAAIEKFSRMQVEEKAAIAAKSSIKSDNNEAADDTETETESESKNDKTK